MKKLLLLIVAGLWIMTAHTQQVPREQVVLEIGTGTWCQYCPGAAMGADDLIANGCQVAVIENHNGDPFANTYSNARNSYYNISGYPTAFFDGILSYVGGSYSQSMYSNYLPLYQQRIAINSDFTIEIYGQASGQTYDIQLVINKVAGSWGNLKVHLTLTESEIVYSWQGQSHLNFVNRLMVPDQNGTTIDWTNQSSVTLSLQFTKDPSWVNNHCELVAFIQNDGTKECLQAQKVALNDLQPLSANANFASNSTTPCVNSYVDFIDQSGGQIVSWNWTFEGGNPPASTLQNPVVQYNTVGSYDVELIVYDGTVYDTLLSQDYIYVITDPVQANTPWGQTEVCYGTTSVVYYTNLVQWATTYLWTVDPSNAGTISGPDTNATFIPATGYMGAYVVKARAINDCGNGIWSEELSAEIYYTPMQFTLSDGAGYCEGGPGVELTLDGSETGVNYELYLDNVPTGTILPGTGSALNFGYQAATGIYTCQAYTDYCSNQMIGNSYIYVIQMPTTAATPTGPTQECNNHSAVEYTTTGSTNATSYQWSITPDYAGSITGTSQTALVDWADDFTGMAFISVTGVNSCGSGSPSGQLQVSVAAPPQPEITGQAEVCDYEPGVLYSTANNTGSNFNWEVTGGTITAGAGMHAIQVTWGAPGTGMVKVTETSADGCEMESQSFDVLIDDCTGVGENSAGVLKIYPNPAKDVITVEYGETVNELLNITILNTYGQVMIHRTAETGAGLIQIDLSSWLSGVYMLKARTTTGVNLQHKIIKSN
ncbi:MAG: Omp28-related outer membrane protein [Bacteroidales bacterium]|nr:Omp28-related outer membrane protein [Bacteroidales bacterium]